MLRIEFQRTAIVGQRLSQGAGRVRHRRTHVEGRRAARRKRDRRIGELARLIDAASRDQDRHFGDERRRRRRIERTRLGKAALGLCERACCRQRPAAHAQHPHLGLTDHAVRTHTLEQLGVAPLQQIDLAQRNRDLGRIDPQTQRFVEGDLGRPEFALDQVGAAEQQLRRKHVAVLLQRVLELDHRTGNIILLEALETILVIATGRRRVCMGRRQRQGEGKGDGKTAGERAESGCHLGPGRISES